MQDTSGLALYQTYSCPFCVRVRRALKRLGISVEIRDLREKSAYRRELIDATGRQTVPVLRIEESDQNVRWLPESRDIVRYLEDRFG